MRSRAGDELRDRAPGRGLTLVFGDNQRRYSRHWSEWFIGLIVSRARTLSGRPEVRPVQVKLQHPPPANQDTLRSILGCPVVFSSSITAVTFDHATLALPVRDASAFLSRVLTAHAERDLRLADTADPFSVRVKRTLIDVLDKDGPRLQDLARRARCSVRTLQARLHKEGTSYEKLLDGVRRQLALQYIADDTIRLLELPLLLKFAEPSPFHRAFRRWTGKTPLAYRRALQSRASESAEWAANFLTSPTPMPRFG